jgi:hypothetical protein
VRNKLPILLSTGVTATIEGLEITDTATAGHFAVRHSAYGGYLIPWLDAAERLRYREGEPWCTSSDGSYLVDIVCREPRRKAGGITGYIFGQPIKDNPLHRLAAILCDDADGFRVLHWCVTNLGGE